ncbi:17908_t:CDS:1, partial [Gigaspora margarita]
MSEVKIRNHGIPARYEIKGILEEELECIKYLQELGIIYKQLDCSE